MTARLPGLVIHTPLPPTPSGIADYAAELLPELARHLPVVAVIASDSKAPPPLPRVVVLRSSGLAQYARLRDWPHVFQLGNSTDCAHGYLAALARPGIAVLHDPVLHHLVAALTRDAGRQESYADALAAEYGEAGRRQAMRAARGLMPDVWRFRLPLNGLPIACARGVNRPQPHGVRHAAAAGRHAAAGARDPAPPAIGSRQTSPRCRGPDARRALGWPAGRLVVLSLGLATPAKRIPIVLEAVAQLRAEGIDVDYVIGGAPHPDLDLPGRIAALGLGGHVRVTGWLDERAFLQHVRAADLLVNLRWPLGGESSGVLARALGMGLPAIVDAIGASGEYPDRIVTKLPPGPDAAVRLAALAGALLRDPAARAAQAAAARAHMQATASLPRVAAAWLDAIAGWHVPPA